MEASTKSPAPSPRVIYAGAILRGHTVAGAVAKSNYIATAIYRGHTVAGAVAQGNCVAAVAK